MDLARWNAEHSDHWNHFRTALRQSYPDLEFFRGIEVQKRGALHDHVLIRSRLPLTKRFVRELAIRCGFGHSVDLQRLGTEQAAQDAASYAAKYVTKSADAREEVPWAVDYVNERTGEVVTLIKDGRYRTWSSSQGWGLTMKAVRRAVAEHVRRARVIAESLAAPAPQLVAAPLSHTGLSPPAG